MAEFKQEQKVIPLWQLTEDLSTHLISYLMNGREEV